ncbi:unnamed protein product [Calypogeia fissa]
MKGGGVDRAALWTNGRYFLQAKNQLGSEWTLTQASTIGVPTMSEWIRDNMPEGSKVRIDPYLFLSDAYEELKRTVAGKDHTIVLISETNLVDQVWGRERLSPPSSPLRLHDMKFAGVDTPTKFANCQGIHERWFPKSKGVQCLDLTLGLVALDGHKLWLDPSKVSVAIIDSFNDACLKYYADLKSAEGQELDPDTAEKVREGGITQECNGPAAIYRLSPLSIAKALKNAAELEGMK